jgi:hypothetical protein
LNSKSGVAGLTDKEINKILHKIAKGEAHEDDALSNESFSPERFTETDGGKYTVTLTQD